MARNKGVIRYTILTALLIGLLNVLLYAPQVEAHATLLESNPSESVVIEESPPTVNLHFNEPMEQDLAHITVYDWNAKPVFTGNPDGESERSPVLEFALPKLKNGTYTVHWNVVSLDGHPVSGSYFFAIGEATEGGVKSVTDAGESVGLLIVSRTIAEGLLLLGAGFFWFAWLAGKRHFPGSDTLFRRGRRIGAIFLFFATIAELVTYITSLPVGIFQTVINGRAHAVCSVAISNFAICSGNGTWLVFIHVVVIGYCSSIWWTCLGNGKHDYCADTSHHSPAGNRFMARWAMLRSLAFNLAKEAA